MRETDRQTDPETDRQTDPEIGPETGSDPAAATESAAYRAVTARSTPPVESRPARRRVARGVLVAGAAIATAAVLVAVWGVVAAHRPEGASFGSTGPTVTPAGSGSTAALVVTGHGTMPTADPALLSDLTTIAAGQGISLDQAIAKYVWQDEFGEVSAVIQERYPDVFASAAINPPGFVGGLVRFTDAPQPAALDLLATLPVSTRVEVGQTYTATEIQALLAVANPAAYGVIGQVDGGSDSWFDEATETFMVQAGTGHGIDVDAVTAAVQDAVRRRLPDLPMLAVRVELTAGFAVGDDVAGG